jgi:hypothetical protein
MDIKNFNKYKLGNFVLKSKHIYAKEKLILIYNNILKELKKQYGGSIQDQINVDEIINKLNTYIDNNFSKEQILNKDRQREVLINGLVDQIKTYFETYTASGLYLTNYKLRSIIDNMMEIDKELNTFFENTINLINNNHSYFYDNERVKNILVKIQKELFKFQVKLIFSKIKKADRYKDNIIELLDNLRKKISIMNSYLHKLTTKYTDDKI